MRASLLFSVICICFVIFATQSCLRETKHPVHKADTLSYDAQTPEINTIIVRSSHGIPSTQRIFIVVDVKNISDSSMTFDFDNFQLVTVEGRKNLPISCIPTKVTLAPGEKYPVTLTYNPVNDLKLFHEAGHVGDIREAYDFQVVSGDHEVVYGNVRLVANADEHQYQKDTYGVATTLQLHVPFFSEQFLGHQKNYLDSLYRTFKRQPLSRDVRASGNEILVNGLWLKMRAQTVKDSLVVHVRLVNKSGNDLHIDSSIITALAGESRVKLQNPFGTLSLKDGGREELSFVFHRPGSLFLLDLQGLRFNFGGINKAVFSQPIPFNEYR
jgi:hypothetical protein